LETIRSKQLIVHPFSGFQRKSLTDHAWPLPILTSLSMFH
jgi:hypothetical protein